MSTVSNETAPIEEQEELDFPLPFKDLPPDLQKRAIESFRDSDHCWHWDDNDFLQENLAEVLDYEFGLTAATRYRLVNGRRDNDYHAIYWDQYNYVEFEVDEFNIEEVIKHARNDAATVAKHGTCYFQPKAAELAALLHAVEMIELGMGVAFNASYRITEGNEYSDGRVEWEWPDGGHPHTIDTASPEYQAARMLFARINETLKAYHEAARRRLKNVIEDEEAWRYSDECIRDTLEGNDHWTFDEEGRLV